MAIGTQGTPVAETPGQIANLTEATGVAAQTGAATAPPSSPVLFEIGGVRVTRNLAIAGLIALLILKK